MLHQTKIFQSILGTTFIILFIATTMQQNDEANIQTFQNEINRNLHTVQQEGQVFGKEQDDNYMDLYYSQYSGQWNQSPFKKFAQSLWIHQISQPVDEQLGFIRKKNGSILIHFNDLMLTDNKMLYIYLYEDQAYEDQRKILIKMHYDVFRADDEYHPAYAQVILMDQMQIIYKGMYQINIYYIQTIFQPYLFQHNHHLSTNNYKKIEYSLIINTLQQKQLICKFQTIKSHVNYSNNTLNYFILQEDDLLVEYVSYFYDRDTLKQVNPYSTSTVNLKNAVLNDTLLSFTSDVEINSENLSLKNINFCLFCTSIAVTCLIGSFLLYKRLSENESEAKNISLISLGLCIVQDAFLSLVFLWQALSINRVYIIYTVPAICYFLLSTVFEMRLTILAWKEKYYYRFSQQDEVKKGIAIFYSIFYLGLFGFFVAVYFFYIHNEFIFCLSLVFIPQIICTAINGNSRKFYSSLVFGLFLPRIALPLYIRGCPNNIMNFKPSYEFCFLWITSFIVQILIVFLQSRLGPRFFVPSIFLPKQYNYNFIYQYNLSEKETDDCSICLGPLHLNPMEYETKEDSSTEMSLKTKQELETQLIKKKKIYKTPCNHLFHINCLHKWIEIKQECPQCRQILPTIY